jgi:L-threonylcarbamoyladenylate synthase
VWNHIAEQLVAARAEATIDNAHGRRLRFGLMAFDDSPLSAALRGAGNAPGRITYARGEETVDIATEVKSLGRTEEDAARALFRDMLAFEGSSTDSMRIEADRTETQSENESSGPRQPAEAAMPGVDAILIEACSEKGVGLAVMERVNKAVGGGGTGEGLGVRGTGGQRKRFWVDTGI